MWNDLILIECLLTDPVGARLGTLDGKIYDCVDIYIETNN